MIIDSDAKSVDEVASCRAGRRALEPGSSRTLAEKAFETLHTAIITGQLRPGTRLPIEELAEVLEMSPMPIREAVRRLDTLDRMSDDNSAATSAAHTAFHFVLYEGADSAWLLRLIRPVWETAERYCLEFPQCRQPQARRHEHQAMLGACVAHDANRAAITLHDHLATTANEIAEAMGAAPLLELSSGLA